MRRWILAVALLAAGPAIAVDSSNFQLRNAEDLVRACSVEPDSLSMRMRWASVTGCWWARIAITKPR